MMDFQIKRSGRRCHATGRDLQPGEEFVSELVPGPEGSAADFARHDYCQEAWSGPADDSIGWWRCRIPVLDTGRVYSAPADVLREYFSRLLESPEHASLVYVMAMLLVRKRLMRLDGQETDEQGRSWLVVRDSSSKQEFRVAIVDLTAEQQRVIQQEFAEQLFTDQPPA